MKATIAIKAKSIREAEYTASLIINEALKEKLRVSCTKTKRSIFRRNFIKRVSIYDP